jgi:hypothetical protein
MRTSYKQYIKGRGASAKDNRCVIIDLTRELPTRIQQCGILIHIGRNTSNTPELRDMHAKPSEVRDALAYQTGYTLPSP